MATALTLTLTSHTIYPTIDPPNDYEKLYYMRTNRILLVCTGIFSSVSLSVGLWLFVKNSYYFFWFGIFVAIFSFYLMISYLFVGLWGRDFDYKAHLEITSTSSDYKPTVDIFLPVCNEPVNIIENTHNHVAALEWPRDKIKVYVLDDGDSAQVKSLALARGFEYIVRSDRPTLKKAGNLRNGFAQSSGDFIAIFDADFCPRKDFLLETIPYFKHDAKIAILQTPQFFDIDPRNQNWVQSSAGAVQELFYRLIQTNRDRWGAAICVGTCGVYRRESLVPFGGTAAIGYSEDVHTGFSVVSSGWRLKYIPLVLSKGLCPDTLAAFFIQQYRWAMGSFTLMLNKHFWTCNMSVIQKICYMTGMFYYTVTGISLIFNALPGILLIWLRPESVFWYNSAFVLPSILFSYLFMKLWSIQPFTIHVLALKHVTYWSHIFALKDKLMGTLVEWIPTGSASTQNNSRFLSAKIACGVYNFCALGALVAGIGWRIHNGYVWWNFMPTLGIMIFNVYLALGFLHSPS
jgi:cellulose synthase/poly-beta-1,6-N-acetylglucosamine synthase-like glycosyltransferase